MTHSHDSRRRGLRGPRLVTASIVAAGVLGTGVVVAVGAADQGSTTASTSSGDSSGFSSSAQLPGATSGGPSDASSGGS